MLLHHVFEGVLAARLPFGDAEVDQLDAFDLASFISEDDVVGRNVPVTDACFMGCREGVGHGRDDEGRCLVRKFPAAPDQLVEAQPLDVFERHKSGLHIAHCDSSVLFEADNMGMLEERKNLALFKKFGQAVFSGIALDGYLHDDKALVGSFAEEDAAHPAGGQLLDDSVSADSGRVPTVGFTGDRINDEAGDDDGGGNEAYEKNDNGGHYWLVLSLIIH